MSLKLDKRGKLRLTEADVTRQCIDWLRVRGWVCVRRHRGKFVGYSEALHRNPHSWNIIEIGADGDPDWLVFKYAATPLCRLFYLELKEPGGGRVRTAQKAVHEVLRKGGYFVCVANSLEQLRAWMVEQGLEPAP